MTKEEAYRTEVYWSQDERDLAAKMFTRHNRANGALYPGGFGFMSYTDRAKWYSRARTELLARYTLD